MTQMGNNKILIIAVYSHIEAYPPSLNALYHLATMFDRIIVLVPNTMESKWQYPENVQLISFGKYVGADQVKNKTIVSKIIYFLRFGIYLRGLIYANKPNLVLTYDPTSFSLLYLFSRGYVKKYNTTVWYHNHDVADERELPKYSLMWFSRYLELKYFRLVDFFSIPNEVRLKFFPQDHLKRPPIILPNYPSKYVYGKTYKGGKVPGKVLKLIFQGQISSGNSLETFVKVLKFEIVGRSLELHLAGTIQEGYRTLLESLALNEGVSDKLIIHGLLPYSDLPALTSSCHIGIAIYGNHNTMVRSMSTASNKIFEYASLGLPVIINTRSDMQKEFERYSWIHFTDLDEGNIVNLLHNVLQRYHSFSEDARSNFEKRLNFESCFIPFLHDLNKSISAN